MGGRRFWKGGRPQSGRVAWLGLTLALAGCPSTDAPKGRPTDAGTPICPTANPSACFDRGVRLLDRQPEQAAKAFGVACDAGVGGACNNLGALYAEGRGVARDPARAAALYERACAAGAAHGCYSLATIVAEGKQGTRGDLVKAFALASRACALGHVHGCDRVAMALANGQGVGADKQEAMKLWERACSGGVDRACAALGINLVVGADGVTRDVARGERLLLAACNAMYAPACKDLGGMHLGKALPDSDADKGIVLLTNACNLSYGEGCNELGVAYVQGVGAEPDMKRAAELFERACNQGSATGCANLAIAAEHGDGIPKNLQRATTLRAKACKGGHQASCSTDAGAP